MDSLFHTVAAVERVAGPAATTSSRSTVPKAEPIGVSFNATPTTARSKAPGRAELGYRDTRIQAGGRSIPAVELDRAFMG